MPVLLKIIHAKCLVQCLAHSENSMLVNIVKVTSITSIKNIYNKKDPYAENFFTRFPMFMTPVCQFQDVRQVVDYTMS